MMYNNKFVACVKANGKVLREDKETVFLPFGSEYSLLLKNLNSIRAQVKVEIDGQDALDGEYLVVNANSEIDLQRFIKKNNKDQGNRFKFIERTASIENYRGVGSVDGIIRITFRFEKRNVIPVPEKVIEHHYHHHDRWHYWQYHTLVSSGLEYGHAKSYTANNLLQQCGAEPQLLCSVAQTASAQNATSQILTNSAIQAQNYAQRNNDVGITVAGSLSDQKFHVVDSFEVETEDHVIVLNLRGEIETKKVKAPITVKTKLKCTTCGIVNKSNAKFCRECGTSLQIAQ